MAPKLETTVIGSPHAPLTIPRMIVGLWQLAGGHGQVAPNASDGITPYVDAGFGMLDMADFYGPAEDVVGAYNAAHKDAPLIVCTKWCPHPDIVGAEACAAALDKALSRLKVDSIDVLQYHAWRYDNPSYLENLHHLSLLQKAGKIKHISVTNFDLAHLRLVVHSGYRIATNQVHMSVIDTRAEAGGMAEWCAENDVCLLAYGTLLGGFVSEKWLGKPEPKTEELGNTGLRMYKRYIDTAGGWGPFQTILITLDKIAKKHNVSIPAVATRHVLSIPGVASVIVGSRLDADSAKYIPRNLETFSFTLDDEDAAAIKTAQTSLTPIPGDCGDNMRYPPFLNEKGTPYPQARDAADEALPEVEKVIAAGGRVERSSGSPWEPIACFSRGVRVGNRITVAGTTTRRNYSGDGVIGGSDPESQATYILDIICGTIRALGGSPKDITRTRIMYADVQHDWQAVSRAHAREIGRWGIRPANTMVGSISYVVGPEALLEIEAEARVGYTHGPLLRLKPGGVDKAAAAGEW